MSVVVIGGAVLFLILYVFSSFSYELQTDSLVVRWRLPGGIPFNTKTIRIADIADIHRFRFPADIGGGVEIWGNVAIKKGVLIRTSTGLFRRLYITPDDSDAFIERVRELSVRRVPERTR